MDTSSPATSESVFTYGAPQLKFGSRASDEIGYDLSRFGVHRVLVVTDAGVAATGTPQRVADIDISTLTARRYSRSKARYLVEAAQAVASGTLDIENLGEGSAIAAEKALTAQHGIGTWTARYVLMRGGFADAAPVGDAALAAALQRLHQLPERPDADQSARLMSIYAPHRSLATMHLWTYLKEAA